MNKKAMTRIGCWVVKFDATTMVKPREEDEMAEGLQKALFDIQRLGDVKIINITCVEVDGIIVHSIFYLFEESV